jgi:sarcosine oxidase, subunit gamma
VIAEAVRRSPLADYRARFDALFADTSGNLVVRELAFAPQINLRADPSDVELMDRIKASLGFALPVIPNTVAAMQDLRALWLAPDEWFIVGPENQERAITQALRDAVGGALVSIVDLSANRTVLAIGGSDARELLAHGIPIDLDPRSFGMGCCAQTLLAKAHVIIDRVSDDPTFHLYLRSSFASYAADWVLDAAADPF